jgi:hypothetical protein
MQKQWQAEEKEFETDVSKAEIEHKCLKPDFKFVNNQFN